MSYVVLISHFLKIACSILLSADEIWAVNEYFCLGEFVDSPDVNDEYSIHLPKRLELFIVSHLWTHNRILLLFCSWSRLT